MYLPQNTLAQQQHFLSLFSKWIYMTWSSCSPLPYKLTFSKHHNYLPFLPSLSSPSFLQIPTQCCKRSTLRSILKKTKQQIISSHMHISVHTFIFTHNHTHSQNFLFFGVLCLSVRFIYLFTYSFTTSFCQTM